MTIGPHVPSHARGFTLIELMVAIFIMSLLALMSWRGIDSMARAQAISRDRADYIATLQTAFAQWNTDLDQMQATSQTPAIDYNGRVLRMTRRYGESEIRIVAWARRGIEGQTQWLRWQSEPITKRAEAQEAWTQAALWGANPRDADRKNEVEVASIDDWQIFYSRGNAWTNPQSSANAVPAPSAGASAPAPGNAAQSTKPDGVRLVLTLSQGQALAGTITRDWIRPDLK